jgi:hypothetical protein
MKRRDLPPSEEVKRKAEELANDLSQFSTPYQIRAHNSCGSDDDPQAKFVDIVR